MPEKIVKILDTLNKKQLEVLFITFTIMVPLGWTFYAKIENQVQSIERKQIRIEETVKTIATQVTALHNHFLEKGLERGDDNGG